MKISTNTVGLCSVVFCGLKVPDLVKNFFTSNLIKSKFVLLFLDFFLMISKLANPFSTNVRLMDKPGSWFFTSKMFEKQLWKSVILSKDAGR